MRIIYPKNKTIAVLVPNASWPIDHVARKDVPAGVPYRIVDDADIPTDRSQRDLWTADFSTPDGYGIGADAWFAEQEAKK
ncbi:MAG: hypothetical protein IT552_12405 [Sphingomonadaceae bacterium]|nr:hypothetical protein [Sphingomonadaceae bacterium]